MLEGDEVRIDQTGLCIWNHKPGRATTIVFRDQTRSAERETVTPVWWVWRIMDYAVRT